MPNIYKKLHRIGKNGKNHIVFYFLQIISWNCTFELYHFVHEMHFFFNDCFFIREVTCKSCSGRSLLLFICFDVEAYYIHQR
jgi:hypothetical protein